MPFGRVDFIIEKVLRKLKQKGQEDITAEVILIDLDEVALDIAQRAMTLKGNETITLEDGEEFYDIGKKIYRINKFVEPHHWTHKIHVIAEPAEWKRLVECHDWWIFHPLGHRSTEFHRRFGRPLFATVWDERLRLWPVPHTTGDELQCFV